MDLRFSFLHRVPGESHAISLELMSRRIEIECPGPSIIKGSRSFLLYSG